MGCLAARGRAGERWGGMRERRGGQGRDEGRGGEGRGEGKGGEVVGVRRGGVGWGRGGTGQLQCIRT